MTYFHLFQKTCFAPWICNDLPLLQPVDILGSKQISCDDKAKKYVGQTNISHSNAAFIEPIDY